MSEIHKSDESSVEDLIKRKTLRSSREIEEESDIGLQKISFKMLNRLERIYKGKIVKEIDNAIEKYTDYLKDLNENWDGLGAKAFNEYTINRTTNLIKDIMDYFTDQKIEFFPPKILPLRDGSLDITWKGDYYRLIINIPANPYELVEGYGDVENHQEDVLDFRLNYNIIRSTIIEWLKKTLRYGR